MGNLPPPLLRRSWLLPGESLSSLLARLVRLNHYEIPALLTGLCLGGQRDGPAHPRLAATYERLAALTKIDAEELYEATRHVFTRVLVPPGIEMATVRLPVSGDMPLLATRFASKLLRSESAAQYCPACLDEAAYHRLAWLPVAAAACLKHECLLLTGCPRCGKEVHVQAIALACCNHCGADLRQVRPTSVMGDEHGLFVQQAIQAWFSSSTLPIDDPRFRTLPVSPPNVLFRSLEGLRWAVESTMQTDPDWEYMHSILADEDGRECAAKRTQLTPTESYRVYATAFRALLDWPGGFHEFLQAYNFQEKRRNQTAATKSDNGSRWRIDRRGLHADLGAFYAQWIQRRWAHPAFEFLQDAFDQYAVDTYTGSVAISQSKRYRDNPDRANKFPCATVAEAARMLGTTRRVVRRLLGNGQLATYGDERIDAHLHTLIRRAELVKLKKRWERALTLEQTARLLAVNRHLVVQMAEEGALPAERGPCADGGTRWMFTRQAVDECMYKVICLTKYDNTFGMVSLASAAQMVATVGLNAAALLKRVRKNQLSAYYPPEEEMAFGKLLFYKEDINRLIQDIRAALPWISREDIARRMGVKATVVAKWVHEGLLTPAAPGCAWYFVLSEVEQFIASHVFTEEAAQILEVDKDTVLRWVRLRRLRPVIGPRQGCHRYLFRREDVVRLRSENRLTAPQLAKRMGISRGHVLRLVHQGRLKPISGPGIDNCKHFLFEVPPGEVERLAAAVP